MFKMGTFEGRDPEFGDTTELLNHDQQGTNVNGKMIQWENETYVPHRVYNFVFEPLDAEKRDAFLTEYNNNKGKPVTCEIGHLGDLVTGDPLIVEAVLSDLKVTTLRDNCSYRIEVKLQCLS